MRREQGSEIRGTSYTPETVRLPNGGVLNMDDSGSSVASVGSRREGPTNNNNNTNSCKTATSLLYELNICLPSPKNISYHQLESSQPRTRGGRFTIQCHLNGVLYGTGTGPSKKAAKQNASQNAIDALCMEDPEIQHLVFRVNRGSKSSNRSQSRTRFLRTPSTSVSLDPSSTSPVLSSQSAESERVELLDQLRDQEQQLGRLLTLEQELSTRVKRLLNLENRVHRDLYDSYMHNARQYDSAGGDSYRDPYFRPNPYHVTGGYPDPRPTTPEYEDTYEFMQRHKYGSSWSSPEGSSTGAGYYSELHRDYYSETFQPPRFDKQ